ncbi:hypothetical protein EDC96DRAFT_496472 [Choanephora cucurbitarum]|nr:hypothetical protein EDC96DRAFT_496472 [Choanephora cucurbitarum]
MQITAMPATSTLFKSKLNHFITKLSHPTKEEEEDETPIQKQRKPSYATSVESTSSMADRFRQVIPFFRRRSSGNVSTLAPTEETAGQPSSAVPNSSITMTPISPTTSDYVQSIERLRSLYKLAIDELNYAIDSQGSSYYPGDLVTAREALDDCANAFMQLLLHTTDPVTRESLQSYMTPRLMRLQKKLDALPEVDEDNDYY